MKFINVKDKTLASAFTRRESPATTQTSVSVWVIFALTLMMKLIKQVLNQREPFFTTTNKMREILDKVKDL